MKVIELYEFCMEQIVNGNGEKEIYLYCNTDGDRVQKLLYSFESDTETISSVIEYYGSNLHSDDDEKNIVLLG